MDPKLIVASRVLELPQQELEQAVEQELNDNPALERVETDDGFDENELIAKLGRQLGNRSADEFETASYVCNPDEDWWDFLAAPVSLRDHLLAQILPMIPEEEAHLARHIVDCVNDKGYLDLPVEEIAHLVGADLDKAARVVEKLQSCDPPGVGAHDVRECLELQLRDADDEIGLLAREIVRSHWDYLRIRRISDIAHARNIPEENVQAAFDRIASLTPYPAGGFVSDVEDSRPGSGGGVTPDVVFRRDESGIRIEVRGYDPAHLMLNRSYRDRYRALRAQQAVSESEERKHVIEFVARAMNLIRGLHQRRRTLLKIATHLLKEQIGFVTTGSYDFLKPMTRTQLARAVGMHGSTVSRATMQKFAQIANGEVVPFEVFFKRGLRAQKMIEEILLTENSSVPLSDRMISEILKKRGVHMATRTVHKYRERAGRLSSRQRRTA